MTNVPIYGCVGCSGPGGRLACPEHGFHEVVERDAKIARLQAEAEVTTREAITVRTRLYEVVAEVERLIRENKERAEIIENHREARKKAEAVIADLKARLITHGESV